MALRASLWPSPLPHSRAEQKVAENPGPLPTHPEEAGAMGQLPVTTAIAEGPGLPQTDSQAAGGLPSLRTLKAPLQGTLPSASAISRGPESVTSKVLVAWDAGWGGE